MKRFMGFVVASLAVMGAGYAWADWQQTAAGTYNYDDPANWTDGTPNGVFPSTLTLTGDQTVVFTNDTAIAALDFSYAGDYKMTLRSDGTGPKTLSLSGDIQAVVNKSVQAAHVTIGSADALSNLVLDLGGASRTITASASQNDPSKIGRFVSYAKLTNGAVRYEGAGVIKLYGTSDYADGTVLANTGYIYLNADAALGSGTNETVSTASVWPRLHTDVAGTVIANPWLLNGDFGFHGASMTLSGDFVIPAPIRFWCESDNLTISASKFVDLDGNCALANFAKWGSKQLRVDTAFAGLIDATINIGNGVWNQYGAVSCSNLTVNGSSSGTQHLRFKAANYTLAGQLTLGEGFVYIYFEVEGTMGEDFAIFIPMNGTLVTTSAYGVSDLLPLIDVESEGVLALGLNEGSGIDLSGHPTLRLGASGGNSIVSGTVIWPSTGVIRLGGGDKFLTFSEANALPSGKFIDLVGTVMLTGENDTDSEIRVRNGVTLYLSGAAGAVPDAKVVVEQGGVLNLQSSAACDVLRAGDVTLKAGMVYFAGNSSSAVKHRVTKLTLLAMEGVGGTSQMKWSSGSNKQTTLAIGTIVRPTFAFLNFDTTGGALGATEFTSGWNIVVDSGVEALGGGTAGTTTAPIVPWVRTETGFVSYDAVRGFRVLDTATERQAYAVAETREGPITVGENMFFNASAGGTLALTGTEMNLTSFAFGYQGTVMQLTSPNGKVNVTGAGIMCDGNATTTLAAAMDFGANRGYIYERMGKRQTVSGPIAGSGGLTIGNWSTANSTASTGTGLNCAFKDSTFTGDVHIFDRVDSVQGGCFPFGSRSGDTYLHGYWLCGNYSVSLNGLSGAGYLQLANGYTVTFTLGCDGSDGDFDGRVYRSNGTLSFVKTGLGRQRFGGSSNHNGTTSVDEGALQIDGVFSQSAVSVASAATLAGCGIISNMVTLADGATLEIGSAALGTEDTEMALNGGLTLSGNATLAVKTFGKSSAASVTASSIVGAGAMTVNVDSKLSKGDYLLVKSAAAIPFSLVRGANCGVLTRKNNDSEIWMYMSGGTVLVVR